MATMVRIAAAVLLTLAVGGMLNANDARAQPSVCLNLAAGTYELEAPSLEREGNVVFRVVIGEGGEIVEFYEPGGVEIGAAAGIGIFMSGEYELPEGVAIAACPSAGDDSILSDDGDSLESMSEDDESSMDSMSEDDEGSLESMESESAAGDEQQAGPPAQAGAAQAGGAVCVNLDPGTHMIDVTAFGIAMSVTAQIGPGGEVVLVDAGDFGVHPGAAVAGMIGTSIVLPPDVQVVACAFATTGTGGLLDQGLGAQEVGLVAAAALGVALLSLLTLLARRRSRGLA